MARINFDLQQLQAFLAVAERNSFRAAAEAIHLSPPALGRRIDKLRKRFLASNCSIALRAKLNSRVWVACF